MPARNQCLEVLTVTINPAVDITASVENFQAGQLNRVQQATTTPGGKGINVASALADFGHRVGACGFLGRENAALFEQFFRRKQIADHMARLEGPTRLCIKVFDPSNTRTTEINFPGLPLTDPTLLLKQIERADAPWIVLAGSLPTSARPQIYADLIKELHRRGRKVLLDTSGTALRIGLKEHPEIIKPNLEELEELVGEPLRTPEAIASAVRAFTRSELAVVSMAEKGACFINADRALLARPPERVSRTAVGAGDAMVAGILSARIAGFDLEALARRAVAFSLDWIHQRGAGLSSPKTLETLASRVHIQPL